MYKTSLKNAKLAMIVLLVMSMLLSGLPVFPGFQTGISLETAQAQTVDTPFSWDNATVYFVMIDRFHNGDTSNDTSYGRRTVDTSGKKIGTFHGGDVKGLTQKMNENYFTDLGVNAIWITAPYEQVHGWVSGGSQGDFAHYAYHGYYPLDWTMMDKNYGTVEEFRTFVDLAHSKGIRIVMDVVLNHVGYGTLRDMSDYGFGGQDAINNGATWDPIQFGLPYNAMHGIIDYKSEGTWNNWWKNWVRAGLPGYTPAPPLGQDEIRGQLADLADVRTDLTTSVGMAPILNTKWNKEKSGFDPWIVPKAKDLRRDLNIAPADYIIRWLSAWVEEFGIDGFRADTAKHVEMGRWKQLGEEADKALKRWRAANPNKAGAKWTDDFWMTAEVFGLGVGQNSYHTSGGFDSTINFNFQGVPDNINGIDNTFSSYANQINNNNTWNVLNYISSHDTSLYNRNNLMNGGTALLLAPGAAQIFYGDETGRPFGATGSDKDQGTRSYMNWDNYSTNLLQHWQKVGQFRAKHLSVGAGAHKKIADSPYTFSRTYSKNGINDKVVVALGASGQTTINVGGVFANGTTVRDFYTNRTATVTNGSVSIQASTNRVTLLEEVTGGGGGTTPTKPATPTGLTSSSKTATSVSLSWTAVTGVSKYNVYRNDVKVGEATNTTYTDSGLMASTAYNYSITAVNASNVESDRTANVSVTTNSGGGTTPAPTPPTSLDTDGQTKTSISLTWTAPTGVSVKSYNIYRNNVKVGSATTNKYTDSGLIADTDYSYRVSTVDTANRESDKTDEIVITTLPGDGSTGGGSNWTLPTYPDSLVDANYQEINLDTERLTAAIDAADGVRIKYQVFDGTDGGDTGGGGGETPAPIVGVSPPGATFDTEDIAITFALENATSGKYTINGSDPKTNGVTFNAGQSVSIGGTLNAGESLTLKLYAISGGKEATASYTFTKQAKPTGLRVHFKKPTSWQTAQLYYYEQQPSSVPGVTWQTAPAMTATSDGWFTYEIPGATSATVIFKDTSGNQIPGSMQPGFPRSKEGWYDGSKWLETNPLATVNSASLETVTKQEIATTQQLTNNPVVVNTVEDVKLQIPYSAIAQLREQGDAILEIVMPNASYDLHVNKIDWNAINSTLTGNPNAALSNLVVNLYFERVEDGLDLHKAFTISLGNAQAEAVSDLYRFSMTVTNTVANKTTEVNEVQGTFIGRKIKLSGEEDTASMTAVMYNPKTGVSSYIPATVVVEDGVKYAQIFSTHHALVGLAMAEKSFVDIATHPGKADIQAMASKLVVNGVSTTRFSPNSTITRAQFAAMIVKALGLQEDKAASKFNDVPQNAWFAGSIGTAFKYKIISGRTATTFKPNDTITREEMMVIIARVVTLVEPTIANPVKITSGEVTAQLNKFNDRTQIASWARTQIAHAAKIGIISSTQGSAFGPKARVNRGESTVMIKRLLDYAFPMN